MKRVRNPARRAGQAETEGRVIFWWVQIGAVEGVWGI